MDRDLEKRVVAFVAREAGIKPDRLGPDVSLLDDLDIDGDDASELLGAFAKEFGVDLCGFAFERHFGPEGCGADFFSLWLRRLFSKDARKGAEFEPVTIRDLVEAAQAKRWLK